MGDKKNSIMKKVFCSGKTKLTIGETVIKYLRSQEQKIKNFLGVTYENNLF